MTWEQIAPIATAGGMTAVAWILLWHKLKDGDAITKALQAVSIALVTMQQTDIIRTFTMALPPDADNNEQCKRCEQGLAEVKRLMEQQLAEFKRVYGEKQ